MSTYNAGDASLNIVPDARGFKAKLEAEMRRLSAELNLPITADTKRAREQTDRFRTEQQHNDVEIPVRVDTKRARADMAALRAELENIGTSAFLGGGSFKGALGWGGLASAFAVQPAIITGLADLAAGVQQVAQAGLALPGVFGGIGATFGTVKLATGGMSDALKELSKASSGSAKDVEAANKALAGLSPNAAGVVKTLSDLTPVFKNLRNDVSQNLFAGMGDQIKHVVSADLPVLRKGLSGVAIALNADMKQLGVSLSDGKNLNLIDRLFGNTADAQQRLTKAIDPIVHGLGTLVAGSSGALPRLADDLGRVAERFDHFITAADGDGRLAKWIDDGITGVEKLGDTVLNIGKAFTAITQAAGGGDGFLTMLDKGSQKLQEFLNSDHGQNTMKQLFEGGRQEMQQLLPILQNLGPIAGAAFGAAQGSMNLWLPVIRDLTGLLAQDPELVEAVTTAFLAWKTISGVTSLLTSLTTVSTMLSSGLPGAAATGATGISAALSRVAVPAWLMYLVGEHGADIQQWAENNIPGAKWLDSRQNPGDWGYGARQAFDRAFPGLLGSSPDDLPPNIPGGNGPHGSPHQNAPRGLPMPGQNPMSAPPSIAPTDTPGHASGGPTLNRTTGPTGGYIAELHPGEWVLPAHARKAIGDQALWAITAGRFSGGGSVDWFGNAINFNPKMRIDLSRVSVAPNQTKDQYLHEGMLRRVLGVDGYQYFGPLPYSGPGPWNVDPRLVIPGGGLNGYDNGGYVDANGNPVTPGVAPGPAGIAPNPTGGTNLVNTLFSNVVSGLQGPAALITNLATAIPGMASSGTGAAAGQTISQQFGVTGLTQAGTPLGNFASQAATLPGIAGLFSSFLSPDPVGAGLASASQNLNWLAGWGMKTATGVGSTLLNGALSFFGLQNSILSPSNIYNQALAQAANYYGGESGPLGAFLKGSNGTPLGDTSSSGSSGYSIDGMQHLAADRTGTRSYSSSGYPGVGAAVGSGVSADAPKGRVEQMAYQLMLQHGWSADQWPALNTLIMHESGYRATAKNPTSTAYGIGQFLDSTWATVGGQKTSDPGLQLEYMMRYIKQRYGSPQAAWNSYYAHPGGVGWYSAGGGVFRGTGPTADDVPSWLSKGEHVLTAADVEAMGGQENVYRFRQALHRAPGGEITGYVPPNPNLPIPTPPTPRPNFDPGAGARTKSVPGPSRGPATVSTPGGFTPTPAPIAPSTSDGGQPIAPSGFAPIAPSVGVAPTNLDHNLPALSKGITSGFAAAGNIVSSAISAAAAAGSFGAAGVAGGGAAASLVSGLFQEGGKIANDAANVGSSFLVGNVPGSFGTQDRAYGQTVRAPQNVPLTARGGTTWNVNGISDIDRLMQEVDLRDAQSRAGLARYGG